MGELQSTTLFEILKGASLFYLFSSGLSLCPAIDFILTAGLEGLMAPLWLVFEDFMWGC